MKEVEKLTDTLTTLDVRFINYMSTNCDKVMNNDVVERILKRNEYFADKLINDYGYIDKETVQKKYFDEIHRRLSLDNPSQYNDVNGLREWVNEFLQFIKDLEDTL